MNFWMVARVAPFVVFNNKWFRAFLALCGIGWVALFPIAALAIAGGIILLPLIILIFFLLICAHGSIKQWRSGQKE
jgi:hypothetical protein